jgi:hypothetical protein
LRSENNRRSPRLQCNETACNIKKLHADARRE